MGAAVLEGLVSWMRSPLVLELCSGCFFFFGWGGNGQLVAAYTGGELHRHAAALTPSPVGTPIVFAVGRLPRCLERFIF